MICAVIVIGSLGSASSENHFYKKLQVLKNIPEALQLTLSSEIREASSWFRPLVATAVHDGVAP